MRKILSSIGAIIEQYTYAAYGKPYRWNQVQNKYTPVNGVASSIGNTTMYTGREYDREILLTYHRARYYDANLGRFTSRDPIGIQDDINLYTYTGNNPVNYVDRMGREKKFIVAYDTYTDMKKSIYGVLPGSFDLDFVKLSSEEQSNRLQELNKARDYARMLHYNRNQFNTNLPTSIQQAQELGWERLSDIKSQYHQYGVPEGQQNQKWVSGDGKLEVVFRYDTLEIDNSVENKGTYNFFDPNGLSVINHGFYDVEPWKIWG